MYINPLREFHHLLVSGILLAAEYQVHKEPILGHVLAL